MALDRLNSASAAREQLPSKLKESGIRFIQLKDAPYADPVLEIEIERERERELIASASCWWIRAIPACGCAPCR